MNVLNWVNKREAKAVDSCEGSLGWSGDGSVMVKPTIEVLLLGDIECSLVHNLCVSVDGRLG
eukprot:1777569-Rhodomonas_salina.2